MFTILTVCTGNICRSPVAEQLLRVGLAELPDVVIESAGTHSTDGWTMPDQAAALSREFGGDPTGHASRYLVERHVAGAQLVLAMSREHRSAVVKMHPRAMKSSFTIREFARLAEGITDAELEGISALGADDITGRLTAFVYIVSSRRGHVARLVDPEGDDVVDPYRRSDEVYALAGEQLAPAVEKTVRALRRAATA